MTRTTTKPKGDRYRLSLAFAALRRKGYFAAQNFWCCSKCACYDIATEHPDKKDTYVFYNAQEAESVFDASADFQREMYLQWRGDSGLIQSVLQKYGFLTHVEEGDDWAIQVGTFAHPPKKEARW